ncbi:hypothetical protein POVWA2_012540 [Plasmodium ovale wallikeri]|uniref:Uncharacterized protein n=1 Tax=Plasmodium ovale wallikeri TaxID=864142 RepID=A0A1A8YNB2_PLAOA|nr:hypothetical protein POVWA1_011840 [Plasmodium ovale wallikeri]SBT33014.1 hypothetical protein POVWA2_012540 [Plasmodium ovale wallikeri]
MESGTWQGDRWGWMQKEMRASAKWENSKKKKKKKKNGWITNDKPRCAHLLRNRNCAGNIKSEEGKHPFYMLRTSRSENHMLKYVFSTAESLASIAL